MPEPSPALRSPHSNRPAFEVASTKATRSAETGTLIRQNTGGRFIAENITLLNLLGLRLVTGPRSGGSAGDRLRFKWIFVMNGHGAPTHHAAVNEACDFVSETFMVTMLNISGLFNADSAMQSKFQRIDAKYFSAADLSSFGPDMHAGVGETSAVLAVRPDLVRSKYKTLPTLRGDSLKERRDLARKPGWPGYFSAPARAHADYGRDIEAWWVDGLTDLILRAVRGETLFNWPLNVNSNASSSGG